MFAVVVKPSTISRRPDPPVAFRSRSIVRDIERVIASNCFERRVMLKVALRFWSTDVRLTLATLKRKGAEVTVALLATVPPPAGTLTTGLLMHSMFGSLVPKL